MFYYKCPKCKGKVHHEKIRPKGCGRRELIDNPLYDNHITYLPAGELQTDKADGEGVDK